MTLTDEHILIIAPYAAEDYSPSDFDILRELPYVKSVTIIESSGYGQKRKPDREPTPEEWERTTALLTARQLPPSGAAVPNLKYVQVVSAGSNMLFDQAFFKENQHIFYSTSSGTHGPQIAEWIILNLLSFFHRFPKYKEFQDKAHWGTVPEMGGSIIDQFGRTMGVLGYGAIGRQTARIAKALGMTVHAHTFSSPPKRERIEAAVPGSGDPDGSIPAKWFTGKDGLAEFFSSGLDVLVISVPLTAETTNLITKAELELMKGVFLINVARGAIVNPTDLVEAAESGLIAGAALDVTEPEPLPEGHPMWSAKNIIISPHMSGYAIGYNKRVANILKHNIERMRDGAPVVNRVDAAKGY
ncbi:uncharacterized protein V1510DRAFT_417915 [Dipodascopsis tothii]|uniref:uncharacterized protein n=1 Tax=Dipodascopsis tothii TaxID=44089 RepID=UPI0034CF959F